MRPRAGCAPAGYTACLLPGARVWSKAKALDPSLEDLLTRVDEFVGMLHGDFSHVVIEGVPRIYTKATWMRWAGLQQDGQPLSG